MALNDKLFHRELYVEHLEEGAFQYATRIAWLTDEEVGWQDLERLEYAIEAHLDGLVVGGEEALNVCLEMLPDAEFDLLFIIALLFCRLRSSSGLAALWQNFDFDDEQKVRAVSDAFLWECPTKWRLHISKVFESGKIGLFPVLAPILARLQISVGPAYLRGLRQIKANFLPAMLAPLPLLPDAMEVLPGLQQLIGDPDHYIAGAAILASLRLGQRSVLARCRAEPQFFPLHLVVAGELDEARRILVVAETGNANADCLFALGLWGNPGVVPVLLRYLPHETYGAAAAQALHLITGAPLFETVRDPGQVTEDELFEHELEDFRQGRLPAMFAGDEIEKLSQDPARWQEWLTNNAAHFQAGQRYRLGEPATPAVMVQQLIDNRTPNHIRQWVYLELVLRYGLGIHFDPHDQVARQRQSLQAIYQWLNSSGASHH